MVDGEAYGSLRFSVALDQYVAGDPSRIPGSLMRGQYGTPAQRTVACQRGDGGGDWIVLWRVGPSHPHDAFEFGRLPGRGAPPPPPAQRERTVGRQDVVTKPQRRVARHRHALARALGPQSPEVLLQTHR